MTAVSRVQGGTMFGIEQLTFQPEWTHPED
jgi:hypothetical protein